MTWQRTVFGTRARPRYGSPASIAVLLLIAVVLALLGTWVLAILFFALAAGALFIWRMR